MISLCDTHLSKYKKDRCVADKKSMNPKSFRQLSILRPGIGKLTKLYINEPDASLDDGSQRVKFKSKLSSFHRVSWDEHGWMVGKKKNKNKNKKKKVTNIINKTYTKKSKKRPAKLVYSSVCSTNHVR